MRGDIGLGTISAWVACVHYVRNAAKAGLLNCPSRFGQPFSQHFFGRFSFGGVTAIFFAAGAGGPAAAQAGAVLPLALYWRVGRALPIDYTVYVHLLDSNGSTMAQRDLQPLDGSLPTSRWKLRMLA